MIPAPASGVLCWEMELHHLLAGHGEKPPRNRPSTYIVSIKIGYVVPTFTVLHTLAFCPGIGPTWPGSHRRRRSGQPEYSGFFEYRRS